MRISDWSSDVCSSDVAANQEKQAQAIDLYTAFGEAVSWVAPEILSVGEAKINGFIAADDTLGKRFDFYLANVLREAAHTPSPEGEVLLAGPPAPFAGQIGKASWRARVCPCV